MVVEGGTLCVFVVGAILGALRVDLAAYFSPYLPGRCLLFVRSPMSFSVT